MRPRPGSHEEKKQKTGDAPPRRTNGLKMTKKLHFGGENETSREKKRQKRGAKSKRGTNGIPTTAVKRNSKKRRRNANNPFVAKIKTKRNGRLGPAEGLLPTAQPCGNRHRPPRRKIKMTCTWRWIKLQTHNWGNYFLFSGTKNNKKGRKGKTTNKFLFFRHKKCQKRDAKAKSTIFLKKNTPPPPQSLKASPPYHSLPPYWRTWLITNIYEIRIWGFCICGKYRICHHQA